jgi:hypothetical protein
MELSIKLKNGDNILLKSLHFTDKPDELNLYRFVSAKSGGKVYLKVELIENQLKVVEKDADVGEDETLLNVKLEELLIELNPTEASIGTEQNEVLDETEEAPYDPDKIRVDTKSFSLRHIYDMMKSEDIDLAPDFQRNLVWDNLRKSRLIESILLRIPLPMFYFAQDEDGKISVVDGLQRLSTIKEFMDNELRLNGLEYLQDKCGNKYYDVVNLEEKVPTKYFRWFNSTQIIVNVIDPSSPFKLKYDIFRRINTGGQPLNAQEIRNCLASKGLRSALKEMVGLESFKLATGYSVKDVRMDSHEMALRFILFQRKYNADKTLLNYSGNIESELNALTEEFSKNKAHDYSVYINFFDAAMKNAFHLFGQYCFRKIKMEHIEPNARKQMINKAIFVSWSVLLSKYEHKQLQDFNDFESFALPLASKISNDADLFFKLTFSTNARLNHVVAFNAADQIIRENLKKYKKT